MFTVDEVRRGLLVLASNGVISVNERRQIQDDWIEVTTLGDKGPVFIGSSRVCEYCGGKLGRSAIECPGCGARECNS